MGRNDLCFCGSGKKIKNCHPNICENSLAADTLKLYSDLDNELSTKNHSQCKKGCAECCSQFFNISEIEFAIIMDYLMMSLGKDGVNKIIEKALKLSNDFKAKLPDYYNQLEEDVTGYSNLDFCMTIVKGLPYKQGFPCVFLAENNSCSVYSVRPLICRIHGLAYFSRDIDHELCSLIKSSELNKKNMICVDKYRAAFDGLNTFKIGDKRFMRRGYPIFYFFKLYFENNSIDDYFKFSVVYSILHNTRTYFINNLLMTYKDRV